MPRHTWHIQTGSALASLMVVFALPTGCYEPRACTADSDCFRGEICSTDGHCVADADADAGPDRDVRTTDDVESDTRTEETESDTATGDDTGRDDSDADTIPSDSSMNTDEDAGDWACQDPKTGESLTDEEDSTNQCNDDYQSNRDGKFKLGCEQTEEIYTVEQSRRYCSCADDDSPDRFKINIYVDSNYEKCPDGWDPDKHDRVKVTVTASSEATWRELSPQLATTNGVEGFGFDECPEAAPSDANSDDIWCEKPASPKYVFYWRRSLGDPLTKYTEFDIERSAGDVSSKFAYEVRAELVDAPPKE